jgi:hypothetical protein
MWNLKIHYCAQKHVLLVPIDETSPHLPILCLYDAFQYYPLGFPNIIILHVVLYGCEAWSLTLREEHKLRVFEDRVLRRIFGPKRDGVTGGWRKLCNEELHNLYSWPSIIRIIKLRRMRWAGHVA